ncbi:MAG: hypothetical protein AAGC61_02945 [Microbacterium sp.]
MTPLRLRATRTLALSALAVVALAGCSPSGNVTGDGDTTESVALLEEFFGHLEAGETTDAAAMTSIDFPSEFLDEDFYAASAALPSDAKVVKTKGSDKYTVTATVEFVLDDPENPASATFQVKNDDGERTISWRDEKFSIINVASPGRIVVNGELDYAMQPDDTQDLYLLPALYNIAYDDPTGTTQLGDDGTNEFTLPWPMDDADPASDFPSNATVTHWNLSVSAWVEPDVIEAADAQIDALTDACVAERMAGPSCPPEVLAYGKPLVDPSTVEWFRTPATGPVVSDGRVEYSKGFTVRADGVTYPEPAVYTGTLTKDAEGTVTFTR